MGKPERQVGNKAGKAKGTVKKIESQGKSTTGGAILEHSKIPLDKESAESNMVGNYEKHEYSVKEADMKQLDKDASGGVASMDEEGSAASEAERASSEESDLSGEEDSAIEEEEEEEEEDDEEDDEESDDEFEDQGSSSDEDGHSEDEDEDEEDRKLDEVERRRQEKAMAEASKLLHTDDLSSDDEEAGNTIGNIPLRWYEDHDHIGYDVSGKKILKRHLRGEGGNTGTDVIDSVIKAKDDPKLFRRTVYDEYNDKEIVLSEREIEIIRRIQSGAFAHPEFDAEPEYVDYFSSQKEIHPIGSGYEPKRRFLPSKWEAMKVMKIVKGIREGRIKLGEKSHLKDKPQVYLMWNDNDEATERKGPQHIPAPKMAPPGHAESYNPPSEYLLTPEEKKAWEEMDPEDREINFIPKKHSSLRAVGAYSNFIRERFERCLDLYLCPRSMKRRLNIDPESLVPVIPKPRELRPFPNTLALVMKGHEGRVRTVAVDPAGQFVASGGDDKTIRLWELATGRCSRMWTVGAVVQKVVWNPNADHQVLAVASGKRVILLPTGKGSGDQENITASWLENVEHCEEEDGSLKWKVHKQGIKQEDTTSENEELLEVKVSKGKQVALGRVVAISITHPADIRSIYWHYKGDYLATVVTAASAAAVTGGEMKGAGVFIHQISKRKSQIPLKKAQGQIQTVAFHPSKPFLFVATQRNVRVYNLMQQQLTKKLSSGVKWISSMAIHPTGDHVLIGSYDRRLCWFDLDLSSTPFKTLKYHEKAVRSVAYHSSYPLMASASDDGTIHVFHGRVYSDLMTNPLIVPLKILRGHAVSEGLGVMDIAFHPTQPWVISAGSDGTVRVFQNVH